MKNMTLETMKSLKFYGMLEAFQASLQTKQNAKFTADEFIDYLIQAEWDHRGDSA